MPDGAEESLEAREPDVGAILRNLAAEGSFRGIISAIEGLLGLIITGFLTFVVVTLYGALLLADAWIYDPWRINRLLLVAISLVWPVLVLIEWLTFAFYAQGLSSLPPPAAVHLASSLQVRRLLLRIVIALWWLIHAAAAVALAYVVAGQMRLYNPTPAEQVLQHVIRFSVMFGATFAMNTHLLITAYALCRSKALVLWLWRLRVAIDLLVTLLLAPFVARLLNGLGE